MSKQTFSVAFQRIETYIVEVEAASQEEAIEIAIEEAA